MGSEQSSQAAQRQGPRAPPIRRGHTIGTTSRPESSRNFEPSASGNDSPGASVSSDSELPYISYTVNRPIGDSPSHKPVPRAAGRRVPPSPAPAPSPAPPRGRRARDIVVVRGAREARGGRPDVDTHLERLQAIPQFGPTAVRGAWAGGVDLCGAAARLQAHLVHQLHAAGQQQTLVVAGIKEADTTISRLVGKFSERQRSNARNAERLSRVREISHQLSRCQSLLNQTLLDVEELNLLLPEEKKLEPFVWKT